MTARFIVRLLDADGVLLSWAEVQATARPQRTAGSCPFFASSTTQFVIEQAGTATRLSIHWADLDVARVQNLMEPVAVSVGQVCNFAWIEPVWLVPGMREVPLPAVTVRAPVDVRVPVGALSAIS